MADQGAELCESDFGSVVVQPGIVRNFQRFMVASCPKYPFDDRWLAVVAVRLEADVDNRPDQVLDVVCPFRVAQDDLSLLASGQDYFHLVIDASLANVNQPELRGVGLIQYHVANRRRNSRLLDMGGCLNILHIASYE